ncbi:MAG TPA: PqqD family peptide modification chaperone [Bacteroidales bacterium]|nr:PqqD family peptide modification chaperone [Bacteroidales bacterium]
MHDGTIIEANKNIFFNRIDDEIVMMDEAQGKYYSLNPVASRIFEIVQQKCSFRQLLDQLLSEYEITEEECKTQTIVFLNDLKSKNLIFIDE